MKTTGKRNNKHRTNIIENLFGFKYLTLCNKTNGNHFEKKLFTTIDIITFKNHPLFLYFITLIPKTLTLLDKKEITHD